jgi:hypothetical protein
MAEYKNILKIVKHGAVILTMALGLLSFVSPVESVFAADCTNPTMTVGGGLECANQGGQSKRDLFKTDDANGKLGIIPSVIEIMMYIVGIVSVIMLISAGIMYAVSAGDEAKMKNAKRAIIAAIIGVVFALLAWTLVNFVFKNLK